MIETTSTTVVTCDACGRVIAEGDEWFQVTEAVQSAVFDGSAGSLQWARQESVQLCADDYAKRTEAAAPLAVSGIANVPPAL